MPRASKESKKQRRSKQRKETTRDTAKSSQTPLPSLDSLPAPPTPINNRQKPKVMTIEGRIAGMIFPQLVALPEPTQVWCLGCDYPLQCDKRQAKKGKGDAFYFTNWTKHARTCMRAFVKAIMSLDECDEAEANSTVDNILNAWKTTWTKEVALVKKLPNGRMRPNGRKSKYFKTKISQWRQEVEITKVLRSMPSVERPGDVPQEADARSPVDTDAFPARPRRERKEFFDNPATPASGGGRSSETGMTTSTQVAGSPAELVVDRAELSSTLTQLAVQPSELMGSSSSYMLHPATWRVIQSVYRGPGSRAGDQERGWRS